MEVDVDEFKSILTRDMLYFWGRQDPEFSPYSVFALYLYLFILYQYKNDICKIYENIHNDQYGKFGKIPHIKLLRSCSYKKAENGYGPEIGLKMAKETVEYFLANKYISEIEENSNYHILTKEGEVFFKEMKKCIHLTEDDDIIWIKTSLLENIFDYSSSYIFINEKFITTYLDFVYSGGVHV